MEKGDIITLADFKVGMWVKVVNCVGGCSYAEKEAKVIRGGNNTFAVDFGEILTNTHNCGGALDTNTGRYPNIMDEFIFLDYEPLKIVLSKKLKFLLNEIGISKKILAFYRKLKTHQIRKIFWLKNDITPEMILLLQKYGMTDSFQIINNEYIKRNKSTIKIGKFMQKKLDAEDWNKFSKEYASLMSKAKQEGKVIITNKLIDMLCASDITVGWGSCQSFEDGSDSRGIANLICYLSSNMYLATIENESGKKIFRQWIYLPTLILPNQTSLNNQYVIFGRPYPDGNDIVERFIRLKFMEHILHIKQHINREMKKEERETMVFNSYTLRNVDNVPYSDIKYVSYEVAYPEVLKEQIAKDNYQIEMNFLDLVVDGKIKCLFCGQQTVVEECNGAGDCGCETSSEYSCSHCGNGLNEDEVYRGADDCYCESCFDRYFIYCPNCGDAVSRDNAKDGDDEYYCESCWEKRFTYCESCETAIQLDDSIANPDGETFCNDCFAEKYFICEECVNTINRNELETINGKDYCNDCAKVKLQKVD